jgi:hypothetical protein
MILRLDSSPFKALDPNPRPRRPYRAVQASAWFTSWLNGLELPDPALAAYARRRLARLGIAVEETEGGAE